MKVPGLGMEICKQHGQPIESLTSTLFRNEYAQVWCGKDGFPNVACLHNGLWSDLKSYMDFLPGNKFLMCLVLNSCYFFNFTDMFPALPNSVYFSFQ